ncbi:MAG: hypothetical protein DRQ63_07075 [Gammaproteobacteria bacterium]|nr:MAG: hypothetical protein DRQ63_07075 [Gammaproteobacteria bacterium]
MRNDSNKQKPGSNLLLFHEPKMVVMLRIRGGSRSFDPASRIVGAASAANARSGNSEQNTARFMEQHWLRPRFGF